MRRLEQGRPSAIDTGAPNDGFLQERRERKGTFKEYNCSVESLEA